MIQYGVPPNLGTLNGVLDTISTMSVNKNSKKNALSILAEFRSMGIDPSLASYYFLLKIFCQDRKLITLNYFTIFTFIPVAFFCYEKLRKTYLFQLLEFQYNKFLLYHVNFFSEMNLFFLVVSCSLFVIIFMKDGSIPKQNA